ncbi:interferon-induced protein 44-like isoform X2 [Colossoma macropomum]|uniref:interferon-induced protein 44-like isoform X2 n=1 Tax=Colossoma macropomum TaxID=42526 RepID=UPI0018648BC7|nr:interferon-induced protein 44-like isoform X2 [Colossoma macropomum]
MASIASSLDDEKERKLQSLFSQPVRFHLLYKSSHHGAKLSALLSRFDTSGKFVLAVFLQTGEVRGGCTSRSLNVGREFDDEEAFVFEINEKAKRFPVLRSAKAVEVHFTDSGQSGFGSGGFSFGSSYQYEYQTGASLPVAVSFGKCLHVYSDDQVMYVNFCADGTYGCRWPEEKSARCVDVELHRVQDLGDFLPSPWREVSWTDGTRQSLRQSFVSYKLMLETLPRVRALLLGPVGSGKSSLVNSIRSTMYRRIVHLPNVGMATGNFTKKLKSYDIRAEKGGSPSALSLCDVLAIGDEDFTGLSLSDTLAVIKGHVPEGYQFQSDFPINDKVSGYRAAPTLKDQIHCVLFVLDASKVTSYSSSLRTSLRKLHTTVSNLGIPQLILLTHVDLVCCAVKENMMSVYSSRAVQEEMQKAAELVGLPLSYLLPVKNYISQLSVDLNTDILLLSVVSSILQAVDDMLEDEYPGVITGPHTQTPPNSSIKM